MDEKISKLFLPLLDKLYNNEPNGEPFRKPVDVVKYGCYDYYLYVKHPIDLSTMRERLTNNEYKDPWRFITDMELMFSNAYLFNKKGTPVHDYTIRLNRIWNLEVPLVMKRLDFCCSTVHKFGPQLLFCHGTTPDRYCQIPIGSKYKCYQDQYSFCMPCFNKIDSEFITISNFSCETKRMQKPLAPVRREDFQDCTNDHWQYESFVKCTKCERRVHNICELYPADKDEIDQCPQQEQIEHEQKMLCKIPLEYQTPPAIETAPTSATPNASLPPDAPYPHELTLHEPIENPELPQPLASDQTTHQFCRPDSGGQVKPEAGSNEQPSVLSCNSSECQDATMASQEASHEPLTVTATTETQQCETVESIDDELMLLASNLTSSAPTSPNPYDTKFRVDSKETSLDRTCSQPIRASSSSMGSGCKNSVDKIAARLTFSKLGGEQVQNMCFDPSPKLNSVGLINSHLTTIAPVKPPQRDKFVCNHCYRQERIGFNLRHRKYSARRLPQTRMSRYIETKVNELIRENSPTAGEVTIRILTAYRDDFEVKPEMQDYVRRCSEKDPSQHYSNAKDYPKEFGFTNRAIFAWQEMDGVDVCVFGMHVQEYGEDCPEPNRQVVYLSYLDSVHFFRPKQFRTTVYHEILLSYFKYVKKLGFRRVFIWVCPSRKGDDYIFYRHPPEQRMPTLKRLSDWYVNLLDKGIMAGIVEKHQNIHQFASSQPSIFNIPYLSGDYWPGEFERLLKVMIESQKEYDVKLSQLQKEEEEERQSMVLMNISDPVDASKNHTETSDQNIRQNNAIGQPDGRHNLLHLTSIYSKQTKISNSNNPSKDSNGKVAKLGRCPLFNNLNYKLGCTSPSTFVSGDAHFAPSPNLNNGVDNPLFLDTSLRHESEQPLDLSKTSSTTSPAESFPDDDAASELSFSMTNGFKTNSKKRRKPVNMGYTKKRNRQSQPLPLPLPQPQPQPQPTRQRPINTTGTGYSACGNQSIKHRSSTHSLKDQSGSDALIHPEEELIKNLERSLKRQKEGFIVAKLNECDCSPHFESQRRKEEALISCELMKGREPFLQLARLENYEFSSLRRAKFSSLAMVKYLGEKYFKLEPICNECFSFDTSKKHYICRQCDDYYLCTSCHENTHHEHVLEIMAPRTLPDIDEFLAPCSQASATASISSASSTVSSKSISEINLETSPQLSIASTPSNRVGATSALSGRHLLNSLDRALPLSCHRQKNHFTESPTLDSSTSRTEDVENAILNSLSATNKLNLPSIQSTPAPSHSSSSLHANPNLELDQILANSFLQQAGITYAIDYDEMKAESLKLLTHYYRCPNKEACHKCKFVVLSCGFMSVLMKSATNRNSTEATSNNNSTNSTSNHLSGINLTPAHRLSYQSKDK